LNLSTFGKGGAKSEATVSTFEKGGVKSTASGATVSGATLGAGTGLGAGTDLEEDDFLGLGIFTITWDLFTSFFSNENELLLDLAFTFLLTDFFLRDLQISNNFRRFDLVRVIFFPKILRFRLSIYYVFTKYMILLGTNFGCPTSIIDCTNAEQWHSNRPTHTRK